MSRVPKIDWERVARAVLSELGARVLEEVARRGEASPSEVAVALGETLPHVSYHVRKLAEWGVLTKTRTEPSGGSLKHYYRLARGA